MQSMRSHVGATTNQNICFLPKEAYLEWQQRLFANEKVITLGDEDTPVSTGV